MVGEHDRECDFSVRKRVERAFRLLRDVDLVANGATVATAIEAEGVIWERHVDCAEGSGWIWKVRSGEMREYKIPVVCIYGKVYAIR